VREDVTDAEHGPVAERLFMVIFASRTWAGGYFAARVFAQRDARKQRVHGVEFITFALLSPAMTVCGARRR